MKNFFEELWGALLAFGFIICLPVILVTYVFVSIGNMIDLIKKGK